MAKGKKGKPTRKERRAQKKHILLGDDGEDLDTQLKVLGLTTKCITGDGNCLFRALSDQYYGYDKHHKAIRQDVCQYLEQNKDTYQFFVEDDIPFDRYLTNMRQDGCFGGHMIIVGFAKLRQVDVKIYQPGMIYVIHGVDEEDQDTSEEESSRQVLHIAYHSWEHYSSVRNIDGPYNGMPEIKDNNDMNSAATNIDNNDDDDDDTDLTNSKEKVILTACPDTNIRKIRRLLVRYRGDPDKVIDALYEQQNKGQTVNTNENTSPPVTAAPTNDESPNNNDDAQSQPDTKETTAATVDAQSEFDEKGENSTDNTRIIPETPATTRPPKRLTAQQRKQQAKMRQKEQKREKKQQAAKANNKPTDTRNDVDNTTQTMKQLLI